MIVTQRKRLQLSERQSRVLQLYHQGLSSRAIAERLQSEERSDPKCKKGWGVSYKTVQADINAAITHYRHEAVDFYEDRLVKELMVAEVCFREACIAFEESRKSTKASLGPKGRASEVREVTTSAPDPRYSVEKRKWQDQILKLLGVVREMSKPSKVAPEPEEDKKPSMEEPANNTVDDLAPYLVAGGAFEQFFLSMSSQRPTDVPPANQPRS